MLLTKKSSKASKKVGKYVNSKYVDTLLGNYKKQRWVRNSQHIGKEDSLSVWYSVEELQEFIETAKRNGADGIKLYYGVYDAATAKDQLHEDRQTIVLVATKNRIMENGTAYDKSIYVNSGNGPEIIAYNAGRICPPNCGDDGGSGGSGSFDFDNPGILIDRKDEGMIVI